MKKDVQNVLIPFLLIALMLYTGSFFYTKKITAEEVALQQQEEKMQREFEAQQILEAQILKINLEQEQMLAEQKIKEEIEKAKQEAALEAQKNMESDALVLVNRVTPAQVVSDDVAVAAQQAYAKAQADALAQQLAEQKLLAQQLAQEKADAVAAKKDAATKARKSRAS